MKKESTVAMPKSDKRVRGQKNKPVSTPEMVEETVEVVEEASAEESVEVVEIEQEEEFLEMSAEEESEDDFEISLGEDEESEDIPEESPKKPSASAEQVQSYISLLTEVGSTPIFRHQATKLRNKVKAAKLEKEQEKSLLETISALVPKKEDIEESLGHIEVLREEFLESGVGFLELDLEKAQFKTEVEESRVDSFVRFICLDFKKREEIMHLLLCAAIPELLPQRFKVETSRENVFGTIAKLKKAITAEGMKKVTSWIGKAFIEEHNCYLRHKTLNVKKGDFIKVTDPLMEGFKMHLEVESVKPVFQVRCVNKELKRTKGSKSIFNMNFNDSFEFTKVEVESADYERSPSISEKTGGEEE